MEQFRQKLIDGMLRNGYAPEFAERFFQQICGFGEYGFPESHAASFALLVYVSSWLKCYHPAAFTAAIINSQPMGFYAAAQLIADARKHGVEVLPIDVNSSEWDCILETGALRLGFRLVSGLAQEHVDVIVARRAERAFESFADFVHRTRLRSAALKRLGQADAFRSLELGRRAALWTSLPEREPPTLFDAFDRQEPPSMLPPMTPFEEVLADYGAAGLTLRQHPVSFLRGMLNQLNVTPSDKLGTTKSGARLKVGGIVLIRQRPSTAKGITFVTLEDETGTVNLIVRPEVWEKHRRVARGATALIAHGILQNESNVIHVLVNRLEDLSEQLGELTARSRDFH